MIAKRGARTGDGTKVFGAADGTEAAFGAGDGTENATENTVLTGVKKAVHNRRLG